jgi:uncharacterized membrane protein YhaH (DUF805 family)
MEWYLKVVTNYVTFSGRARRKEYWMFVLFNALIMIGLSVIAKLIHPLAVAFVPSLYSFGMFLPTIAVGIRRMHDLGRSGWWLLCPIVNFIFLFIEGQPTANEYGPNPKHGEAAMAA